jgi:hypothetical protein
VVAFQAQGQATQGRDLSTLAPLRALRARTSHRTWARRAVGGGVRSCPRAGCGRSACPVRRAGCGNGDTATPLRHRQTKEAETDMCSLKPPRHISTPPKFGARTESAHPPRAESAATAAGAPFGANNRPRNKPPRHSITSSARETSADGNSRLGGLEVNDQFELDRFTEFAAKPDRPPVLNSDVHRIGRQDRGPIE